MNGPDRAEHRRERAVFETDRQLIVGDVTLPPEGYQSRFSDALNRVEVDFIPVTDVEVTELVSGAITRHEFAVIGKAHVKLAYPLGDG